VNRKKKYFDLTLCRTRFAGGYGPTTGETACLVQRPLSVHAGAWVTGTGPRTRALFIVQNETFFFCKPKVRVVNKVEKEVSSCF
jgi:hypothetical protein